MSHSPNTTCPTLDKGKLGNIRKGKYSPWRHNNEFSGFKCDMHHETIKDFKITVNNIFRELMGKNSQNKGVC